MNFNNNSLNNSINSSSSLFGSLSSPSANSSREEENLRIRALHPVYLSTEELTFVNGESSLTVTSKSNNNIKFKLVSNMGDDIYVDPPMGSIPPNSSITIRLELRIVKETSPIFQIFFLPDKKSENSKHDEKSADERFYYKLTSVIEVIQTPEVESPPIQFSLLHSLSLFIPIIAFTVLLYLKYDYNLLNIFTICVSIFIGYAAMFITIGNFSHEYERTSFFQSLQKYKKKHSLVIVIFCFVLPKILFSLFSSLLKIVFKFYS